MDNLPKNEKEIAKKQRKFGKLDPEQKIIYDIVALRIKCMSVKERMKMLKKKAVDNLIKEVREELSDGRT